MRRLRKRFTVPKLPEKYQQWLKRNWWWLLIGLTIFVIAFLAFVLDNWWPRTGFNGKTLWEWLELLGVPLTLAILGYFLQQQEQKRAREYADQQREIAADEAKDEILQAYFDRLSVLLVDKNLLAIASKIYPKGKSRKQHSFYRLSKEEKQLYKAREVARAQVVTPEQQELFYAAVDW
ncbi:hypothetical protein D0962_35165 [Leptolyngbyaceae cyanobacterium CCMR0082]|uniref:Uncharacterized protein n=1 Tax=Adonisia turfae CCMR0082 TaxID=2304604 RepID=A0A6M0SKB2_9CYAN|nr:hypothetical protein [Adonisia turfae]MDV3348190.1 hypothetical protein [Leptothoe sp. LEGE 181152]NEZ67922.1 hypothetical protein [Adonisia turfae CCMR0082]